jgi:uncharacterized protein
MVTANAQRADHRTADRRIPEVDAVRGLALCGILAPNIIGITDMPERATAADQASHLLFESTLHQRFFPIFSFLFGLSCALFLRAAARRSDEPRVVLLARLAYLIPVGGLHQLLQPGEVLLPYAVMGIVILLPATFLPRETVLVLGLLAVTASVTLTVGGTFLIPGLFLLGLATAQYGVPDRLDALLRWIVLTFAVSAVVAVVLNFWQVSADLVPYESHVTAIAGVVTATAYTTGLLLLLRTPVRRPLAAVLVPLGRMALTNYLSATILIIVADAFLHLARDTRYGAVCALAAAILLVQTIFSRAWLARYRYGPAEWAWRSVTWWERVPNRRTGRDGKGERPVTTNATDPSS